MASYKKVAEDQFRRIQELEAQVQELCGIDSMVAALTNTEAKEIFSTFADRAQNRAELLLLIRALSKL